MGKLTLKDLAVDHDYYASDTNYYSNEAFQQYSTWDDFYNEFHDADIDYNLVFRWDVKKRDDGGYGMQVIMIFQRKGIYMPIHIDSIREKDVTQIQEFMKPHMHKIENIWQPLIFKRDYTT